MMRHCPLKCINNFSQKSGNDIFTGYQILITGEILVFHRSLCVKRFFMRVNITGHIKPPDSLFLLVIRSVPTKYSMSAAGGLTIPRNLLCSERNFSFSSIVSLQVVKSPREGDVMDTDKTLSFTGNCNMKQRTEQAKLLNTLCVCLMRGDMAYSSKLFNSQESKTYFLLVFCICLLLYCAWTQLLINEQTMQCWLLVPVKRLHV